MELTSFLGMLKTRMNKINEEGFFAVDDNGEYKLGTWTIIFNTAIYLSVKSYNKYHRHHLLIAPEPKGRRAGFCDFKLVYANNKKIMVIEHENICSEEKLKKKIDNLLESRVKQKILIFYSDEAKFEYWKNLLKRYKDRKSSSKINLIIGPDNIEDTKDYSEFKI